MKSLLFILTIFISASAVAQTKIDVNDASKHIGENVTICTKVYGVRRFDKLTLINVGAVYPKSPLTIIILAENMKNFKDSPENLFTGKDICVTGTVTDYKGKPQIAVVKADEIEVK